MNNYLLPKGEILKWINSHHWIKISSAKAAIGSNRKQIFSALDFWKTKLISKEYNEEQLYLWFYKEYPEHIVELQDFSILKYPITNYQYIQFIKLSNNKSSLPSSMINKEPMNNPVWSITMKQCNQYSYVLQKLIRNYFGQNIQIRLPTEEEWEYCARGKTNNIYPYANDFYIKQGNTIESKIGMTTSVFKYEDFCSTFGVCDLAGNVEEWTSSNYKAYPGGVIIKDDLYKENKQYNILKGGSYLLGGDLTRCARRHGAHKEKNYRAIGFRLVMQYQETVE